MPYETITYSQIAAAAVALDTLAAKGYTDPETVKKVARMVIWSTAKVAEFEAARKMLIEGHAKRDPKGEKLLVQQKNADGDMEDVPNTVQLKNAEAFQHAFDDLAATPINMSGIKLTDADLAECLTPKVFVDLGPMYDYDWGMDEEEEPDIAPVKKKGK